MGKQTRPEIPRGIALEEFMSHPQERRPDPCITCPIKNTQYCHKVNPMAPKYTRAEKNKLREAIDKGQNAFKKTT